MLMIFANSGKSMLRHAVPRCACCAGVKNAMVVALDDDTKTNAEGFGLPAFRMDLKVGDGG
jgi:hypothetical protein